MFTRATTKIFLTIILLSVIFISPRFNATALENGVARTPPMGWNSWNRFGCGINDALVRATADAMVSSGMQAAGYQYVNIDDCWSMTARDGNGNLQADPTKFPNGIKALADYIHSKGLKFGIYGDRGTTTCANYPGSYTHEVQDANTFASWGVDYLKYDNCAAVGDMQTDLTNMRNALAATGRPIVFSISTWFMSLPTFPDLGNLWRTTGDITDSFSSVMGNIDTNNNTAQYAGPGHWNDPDMLEVGNGGMTDAEYRAHFSMWAIAAAPLIAGNDLRTMTQATKDILTAPEVIAVDQDALGIQGVKITDNGSGLQVWSKTLSGANTRAVALLNRSGATANITINWSAIGLSGSATVRDLWARVDLGSFSNSYTASVPSHAIVLVKIVAGGGTQITSTPTRTPTPGITNTPTRTLTPGGPTNTPVSGSLIVQINKGNGIDNTQETGFNFLLKNTGASAVSNISTRIYFDTDGSNAGSGYVLEKYYDQSGVATYSGPTLACGSTYYFTVTYGTASLPAGGQWEIQTALHLSSWASTYSGANDFYHTGYAVGALPVSYTTTSNIPAYISGSLSLGSTPNCGGPTATRTPTPTVGTSSTPIIPTITPSNTATRTNTPGLTATRTSTQTIGASNTPVPPTATRTNTPVVPTATPGGSDACASPTIITGGGSFAITTSATCFKYVNAANKWGGMFTVMNGSSTAANTLKWYGGLSETVTSCINNSQTLTGNGAQLNNFTVAKDSTGAMYLTVTGSAANTISLSIQNWQNGTGCSAAPTPHP